MLTVAVSAERMGIGATVFSTRAGMFVERYFPNSNAAWKVVSFMFAANTRSAVAFISSAARTDSIWMRYEKPVLDFMSVFGVPTRIVK